MRVAPKLFIAVPALILMTGCDLDGNLLKPISANVQFWMGDYRFKAPLPPEKVEKMVVWLGNHRSGWASATSSMDPDREIWLQFAEGPDAKVWFTDPDTIWIQYGSKQLCAKVPASDFNDLKSIAKIPE